jgi:hypothetical protein
MRATPIVDGVEAIGPVLPADLPDECSEVLAMGGRGRGFSHGVGAGRLQLAE